MRCPKCNQWNRSTNLQCIHCGAALEAVDTPSWRAALKDDSGKDYIRVDEDGDQAYIPDSRDVLAREMADFKGRKQAGEALQQQMEEDAKLRRGSVSSQVQGLQERPLQRDPFFDLPAEQEEKEPQPREEAPAPRSRRARDPRGTRVVLASNDWMADNPYDPVVADMMSRTPYRPNPNTRDLSEPLRRRITIGRVVRFITLMLVIGVLGLVGYFGYTVYDRIRASEDEKNRPLITASMMDDLAAHTILIPGEEGEEIFLSNEEVRGSYAVVGGFATITIPDYKWYENELLVTDAVRTVTLEPYRRTAGGRQRPMDPINYEISIPLSPIERVTPTQERITVATPMSTIVLNVRPGSEVYVKRLPNRQELADAEAEAKKTGAASTLTQADPSKPFGDALTDTVTEDGVLTYNAIIQPTGDNIFQFTVRSPYCRAETTTVTIYREPQEIPLDLAETTYTSTSQKQALITCRTIPGATVRVLTPHSDLKTTDLASTGEFSFYALFDHLGDNEIIITADMLGKKTSRLEYSIYYVPDQDQYTRTAWPLNSASDYSELMSNLSVRIKESRVYVVTGRISSFMDETGQQVAVINTSEDGAERPVILTNRSKTTWKLGEYYTIYCDASSSYGGMPWLIARYTY